MKKFTNFCGIFATLFVTTTIVLLASCSQDDDYYDNSEMYTLAEEMGTRGGGGDPGGQPSPVITYVTETPITEYPELCFYPDSVFFSSSFQNSPFVAIDPSLYGTSYIEVDATVELRRIGNKPTVTSYIASPSLFVLGSIPDSIQGFIVEPMSSVDFEVTSIYLHPDEAPVSGRYILYATGTFYGAGGVTIPCTAFIPNRLYN